MKLWIPGLLVPLLLAWGLAACDDDEDIGSGQGCITDTSAGERDFRRCPGRLTLTATIPAGCEDGGCGLIFDVHGYSMNADSQNTGTDLRRLVTRHGGYVLIQPTDPNNNWDPADGADRFMIENIELAMSAFASDPDRVHFGGFSQGGWMAWRMMCLRPDLFASVASIAGGDTTLGFGAGGRVGECFGRRDVNPAVPMLHMHGTSDTTVPFSHATSIRDKVISAMGYPRGVAISPNHTRWIGNGMQYDLLTHGGDHCIQSCQREYDAGEVILEFYENHPRR